MTRRQRIDLALMLIVRRAEREAGMLSRPHSDEPDTPTAIDQERHRDEPGPRHPS
jgi:hypothetical protein